MSAWTKRFLVLLMAVLLVACGTDEEEEGEGGSDDTVEDGTDVAVSQSGITLLRSGSSLQTGAGEDLEVTARVRDEDGRLLAGVPVSFRILNDSGAHFAAADETQTSGNAFLTNDSGAASVLVSSSDPSNRTIEMVAVVNGAESEPLSIPIEGTSLDVEVPPAGSTGQKIELSATLTDAQGGAVEGETLSFSSDGSGAFQPTTATTSPQGRATTQYTVGSGAGNSTSLTVEGAGTVSTSTLDIASEVLIFDTPSSSQQQEFALGSSQSVEVKLTDGGNAVENEEVTFSSSRGSFSSNTANTDSNGVATTDFMTGSDSGPAKINADALGARSTTEVLLVATNPDTIDLQADPGTVAPEGEAQIQAVVRNPDDQRVKNAEVQFSITADTTGSTLSTTEATTDEFGRATTTFEAGDATSANEGVEITAEVEDTGITSTVSLTVSGEALFITIGTGNTISEEAETLYVKPYSVLVTDSSGGPVANANVTLEIVPTQFGKGNYGYADPPGRWVQNRQDTCTYEDTDRDGVIDTGEDVDDDGELEPGNVATLSKQTVTTDESGAASFDIVYPQDHAQWVTVKLTGRSGVAGTESKKTIDFALPVLADDLTDEGTEPPNVISPFGVQPGCTNDN